MERVRYLFAGNWEEEPGSAYRKTFRLHEPPVVLLDGENEYERANELLASTGADCVILSEVSRCSGPYGDATRLWGTCPLMYFGLLYADSSEYFEAVQGIYRIHGFTQKGSRKGVEHVSR